jgi:hypothetical protein
MKKLLIVLGFISPAILIAQNKGQYEFKISVYPTR